MFNIICTRKKINDHKNLVCDKEKFVLTKTYIGNLGIWGAFSQGYMCMVLIFMSVQYFSWKLCCLYNFVLFCEA